MRLTDLADYLRSRGLTVIEHEGWQHRGKDLPGKPDTIICHHTATSLRADGDLPSLRLLVEGRPDLPGPLCQLALSRSGVVHLISSGKANHAGKGQWRGQTSSAGTLGIEAEHDGRSPWPPAQYDAYVRLCAALCRYLEVDPNRVCAHREWALPAGRKVDVTFDMDRFRHHVRTALVPAEEPPEMNADDWKRLEALLDRKLDDRLRILLRAETADGRPTGHPNLRDITAKLDDLRETS